MAASPVVPEDKLALYERAIAAIDGVKRKGKTSPYTSVNGHMFSYLSKDGSLGLRLPKAERDQFLLDYDAAPFEQYGAVMKEYVAVPDWLLRDIAALTPYFQSSYDYARGLKPKPTKRKS